jgi:two-component system, chemotaxis family, chemotaxis protein CheY
MKSTRMKVLVVEDDFTSRLLLQKLLAPYGECHIAVNGKEAVAAFGGALEAGQPYDLVCLDIMMPEKDGHEALREMRGLEEARNIVSTQGAKIIMTTALGDIKSVTSAYDEMCDGYLVKPIDKAKLIALLDELKVGKKRVA